MASGLRDDAPSSREPNSDLKSQDQSGLTCMGQCRRWGTSYIHRKPSLGHTPVCQTLKQSCRALSKDKPFLFAKSRVSDAKSSIIQSQADSHDSTPVLSKILPEEGKAISSAKTAFRKTPCFIYATSPPPTFYRGSKGAICLKVRARKRHAGISMRGACRPEAVPVPPNSAT